MEDSFKHKGMRKQLVQEIIHKGISDPSVIKAIEKVPRHFFFLDTAFLKQAYEDKAFPIGAGQTISQPYTVAFQTQLLQVKKGDKILEIGTGSGYQTAILLELGAKVFTIERQKMLFEKTKVLLDSLKYAPKMFYGDGYKGLPSFAPFDKIIVTAGAPYIPDPLKEQLKVGGIIVIPVGSEIQKMLTVIKTSDTDFHIKEHGTFTFVPLLNNRANDI